MIRALFLFVVVLFSSACGQRVVGSCIGAGEIEDALAFSVAEDPALADFAEGVDVFCVSREKIRGFSYCRRDVDACLMWPGAWPYAGRVYVAEDVDAALAMCHEPQHARPSVWATEDGCQSHEMSCGFDQESVDRCVQHVRALRGSGGG